MTAFVQINSHDAADLLASAGSAEARRCIVDFAAAGLLNVYARKIETTDPSGACVDSLASVIPPALWKRIVAEGVADDVWTRDTVRLAGSVGGAPAVAITGIGFSEQFVRLLIAQHRGDDEQVDGDRREGGRVRRSADVAEKAEGS